MIYYVGQELLQYVFNQTNCFYQELIPLSIGKEEIQFGTVNKIVGIM